MSLTHKIAGLSLAAMALLAGAAPVSAQDKAVTWVSAGGVVKDVETGVYGAALTKEENIRVDFFVRPEPVLPAMRTMIESGNVSWDVIELSMLDLARAGEAGYLEKLDYSKIDPKNLIPPIARGDYGVFFCAYSNVLVQRTDKLPAGKKMESWADFWDVKTFPGPRALEGIAQGNLEFALLADGAKKEDIYALLATEEGADRAFAKMDEIKPHITKWWKNGAESVQLMASGEVFFSTAFNARVGSINQAGIQTTVMWNGAALMRSSQTIMKGAKNKAEAEMLIQRIAARPDLNLEYIKHLPYPSFMEGIYDHLPLEQRQALPTYSENLQKQVILDPAFWASARGQELQKRFLEWSLI